MKNFYTIEKFKQTFDEEGNEILTQIPATDNGQMEIKGENFLTAGLALAPYDSHIIISYDYTESFNSSTYSPASDFNVGFVNWEIGVTAFKFYGMNNYYDASSGNYTYDTTYDNIDRAIKGGLFTGETVSKSSGTDTVVHTFRSNFSPPVATRREINTVFLAANSPNSMFSSVLLDVPCFQETDEVLVITYRYVYERLQIAQKLPFYANNPTIAFEMAKNLGMNSLESFANYPYGIIRSWYYSSRRDFEFNKAILTPVQTTFRIDGFSCPSFYVDPGSESDAQFFGEGEAILKFNFGTNDSVGYLFTEMLFDREDLPYQYNREIASTSSDYRFPIASAPLRRPTDSVMQNTFNKVKLVVDPKIAAPIPFYDLNNVGSSIGQVILSDEFSSGNTSYNIKNGVCELFRAEITAGGTGSVAQYKIAKRAFTSFAKASGWSCSTWDRFYHGDRFYNTPELTRMFDTSLERNKYGMYRLPYLSSAKFIQPLALGEFAVLFNSTVAEDYGIFVHSFNSGNSLYPFKLDFINVPSFLATDIRGYCTAENGTMFVACANTGLWKLNLTYGQGAAGVIATLVTTTGATVDTSCHAVNFGRYGNRFNSDAKLVALFGTDLCISLDGGTTWSVFNAGTTPAYAPTLYAPNDVIGINIHPDHNEVVIMSSPAAGFKITPSLNNSFSSFPVASIRGNQWFGDTGTFTSSNDTWNYSSVHMYGGGNHSAKPLSNLGSFKWGYHIHNDSSSTIAGFEGFNTINTRTTIITRVSQSCESIELFYDNVEDDTYIMTTINNWATISAGMWFISVTDFLANTESASTQLMYQITTNSRDMTLISLGRGLCMGSGLARDITGVPNPTSISDRTSSYIGTLSLIHVGLRDGNNDWYSDNRLNLWYQYGWNGSAWELDNPNSKVASVSQQPLIEGLSIQFVNDIAAPSAPINFEAGDIFDAYAFDGLLKDDFTTLSFDTLVYGIPSTVGDTFTPNTVPASGKGNIRQKISAETINLDGIKAEAGGVIHVEKGHLCTRHTEGDLQPLFSSSYRRNAFASLTPNLSGLAFTLDFQMSFTIEDELIDANTSTNFTRPQIVFVDNSLANPDEHGVVICGIRLKADTTNPNNALMYLWKGNTMVGTLSIIDYNPKVDVYKFVKDTVLNTFVLLRNDVEIASFSDVVTNDTTNLKFYYLGYGSCPIDNISSTVSGYPNEIFNMHITYDDQRLISNVGNGVDSGVFDSSYGRMSVLELLDGTKKLYLDGVEALISYDHRTDLPIQGEIKINMGNGELIFNPADAGKVITGSWRTLPAVNI